jgi:hypothetical protein
MTDSSSVLYTDLAEEVYQRNTLDLPLSLLRQSEVPLDLPRYKRHHF